MMSKAFFYSDTSVVEDDLLRSSSKMFKSLYYSFKKAFFILPIEGSNKYIPTVTFTHTPYLYLLFAATEYDSCFTPVDLYSEYFMLRKALNRTKESTISLHGKHQRATRKALAIQIINCA